MAGGKTHEPIKAGTVFGKLIVLEFVESFKRKGQSLWMYRCKCECGRETVKEATALRRTKCPTRSCGCLAAKWAGESHPRGGKSQDLAFMVWRSIIHRCRNPKAAAYGRYGGRGITVCDRWAESFEAFLEDMGERPSERYSLDRIDNDKGYEPGNCRWATRSEQARNRPSRNVTMTCDGETKLMVEWAEQTGISLKTLHARKTQGWSDEKAIKTPVRQGNYRRKIE